MRDLLTSFKYFHMLTTVLVNVALKEKHLIDKYLI